MTDWKGKTRGGLTGYKIFVTVLKYSGLPLAYFILYFVALYFLFASLFSSIHTYRFYRKRLGYGILRSVICIYRNYYAFGQVLLDKTAVLAGFKSKFTFTFDGEDFLRKMVEEGTGGLLISAHIGNFEMAGNMLERLRTKVSIVMVDAEHEKIKDYLSSVTRKNYNIIVIREDNSHIYELSRAFEEKQIVCIHGDRYVGGSKTIPSIFLGEKAFFPAGPFYLAMKFNVPVSFVFAMKESRQHYHFYATPPEKYELPGNQQKRDQMILNILKEYIYQLEKMIRKYPLQWFNYYNFWADEQ
ncbi:MAG: lipid A biosynthesis acyltransferase [Bacteroidales bacterium]|nr:lipid A biosynthesis acyltransferase [Bacteroidales bacterium]